MAFHLSDQANDTILPSDDWPGSSYYLTHEITKFCPPVLYLNPIWFIIVYADKKHKETHFKGD